MYSPNDDTQAWRHRVVRCVPFTKSAHDSSSNRVFDTKLNVPDKISYKRDYRMKIEECGRDTEEKGNKLPSDWW